MVRVNKTSLSVEQIDAMFTQLAKVVAPTQTAHADAVLSEILGHEEKLMLAKRIAAIILLHENISHYKIAQSLKLSITTISKIAEQKSTGSFQTVTDAITTNQHAYQTLLQTLDNILTLGGILPHYGQARIGPGGFKHK